MAAKLHHHTLSLPCRYGAQLKKHANRTMDRVIAPAPHPLHPKQPANPMHRVLDRDGIACVGEYINKGEVFINAQVRRKFEQK